MLVSEMNHDARIVPHPEGRDRSPGRTTPATLGLWFGDSIGWWEGDTLVVERATCIRSRRAPVRSLSEKGKVTERFTRVSPEQIFYKYEVEDPTY